MLLELREHQKKALKEMHNGCILAGGVGTGKSIAALAYYYIHVCKGVPKMKGVARQKMQKPRDVYIFTTKKKKDSLEWQGDALLFGIGGEENPEGVRMHVDTWNNIQKYADVTKDAFIIFDEQRLVGSGAWVKAFFKLSLHNQWIVLSATPGDTWMDYAPIFIANGFYKNRTAFINRHVVYSNFTKFPKISRYVEVAHLEALRDKVLVDMPYDRHTRRHIHNVLVDYDKDAVKRVMKDRWHIYEDRPIRDVGEMFLVMRKVVNTDVSRLGELMKLMEKHPRLILFYYFDYELKMLRTLMENLGVVYSEWNGHIHQPLPEGDSWVYLVQYTAGNEGWNCITTDTIVFYSLQYSYKVMEQSKGRIDRMNTPYVDLHYYILRSMSPIDQAINRALTTKRNFNEKAFGRDIWPENERPGDNVGAS